MATWTGLRLDVIGYGLNMFHLLYPVLQLFGVLQPRWAALVGFLISSSHDVVAFLRQMIMNFPAPEMLPIFVVRLTEYSQAPTCRTAMSRVTRSPTSRVS